MATAQGEIDHYSASGTLLKSITVGTDFFDSIAVNELTGQIALGTANHGMVVLTDLALDMPTSFVATDPTSNFDSGNVQVSWVTSAAAVPEPSTLAMLGTAAALLACNPKVLAAVRKSPGEPPARSRGGTAHSVDAALPPERRPDENLRPGTSVKRIPTAVSKSRPIG